MVKKQVSKKAQVCAIKAYTVDTSVHGTIFCLACVGAKFTPPSYSKPMPLPTYTQSEKYEKEGVLEMEIREEPELEDLSQQRPHRVILVGSGSSESDVGTCCEFTFFFISMPSAWILSV